MCGIETTSHLRIDINPLPIFDKLIDGQGINDKTYNKSLLKLSKMAKKKRGREGWVSCQEEKGGHAYDR